MFKMSDEKNVLASQDIELKPIRSQVLGSTSSLDLHSVDSKLENLEPRSINSFTVEFSCNTVSFQRKLEFFII